MRSHTQLGYVGLGPMVLSDEYMVANQQGVIESVLDRIKSARDVLVEQRSFSPRFRSGHVPNHVISIVGGRGTGKTSVLMTIVRELREHLPDVLVTDIIFPDQVDPRFPVVGLIAYMIEQTLQRDYKEVAERLTREGGIMPRDPSWTLKIGDTFDVVERDTIGMTEWVAGVFRLLVSASDVVPQLHRSIERIIENTHHRLLVIPIDDADVSIEKAEEVIDTLRTYLATPYVVSLLAIDLPSLERRLRNIRLAALPAVPEYQRPGEEENEPLYLLGLTRAEHQSAEARAEQEYVEELLAKVLPRAARHYLAGLSEWERLNLPFRIPGRPPDRSVVEILREADEPAPEHSGVALAPLMKKHPEILSDNVRHFANQVVMISDACAQYASWVSGPMTDEDREALMIKYDQSHIQSAAFSSVTTESGLGAW